MIPCVHVLVLLKLPGNYALATRLTALLLALGIGAVLLTLADASAALNMVSALCVGANEESQSQRFSNTPTKAGAEYDVILRPGESLTLFLGGGDQQVRAQCVCLHVNMSAFCVFVFVCVGTRVRACTAKAIERERASGRPSQF